MFGGQQFQSGALTHAWLKRQKRQNAKRKTTYIYIYIYIYIDTTVKTVRRTRQNDITPENDKNTKHMEQHEPWKRKFSAKR